MIAGGLRTRASQPRAQERAAFDPLTILSYSLLQKIPISNSLEKGQSLFKTPHERNTSLVCTRLCGTIYNTLLASYDIDSFLVLNLFTVMNALLVA